MVCSEKRLKKMKEGCHYDSQIIALVAYEASSMLRIK